MTRASQDEPSPEFEHCVLIKPAPTSVLAEFFDHQRVAVAPGGPEGTRGKRAMRSGTTDRGGFIKALGLRDVVLMNVVAVVGLRWIARGARGGPAAVTLWALAWIAFFVPLAVACST